VIQGLVPFDFELLMAGHDSRMLCKFSVAPRLSKPIMVCNHSP